MKTGIDKMKLLQFALFLLFLLALLSSCYRCEQHEVATLRFTSDELCINPYSGSELLMFKDLSGDTISFPRGIRYTQNIRFYQYDYETAKLDHQGCQGDYFDADINYMSKSTEGLPAVFNINLYFHYSLDNPTSDKLIRFLILIKETPHMSFNGSYYFNSDSLYSTGSSSPIYNDFIVAFHSSITLGQKVFNNTYELYCYNKDPRDSAWISNAYYSIKEGLVGFKTSDNKIWYLDRIN